MACVAVGRNVASCCIKSRATARKGPHTGGRSLGKESVSEIDLSNTDATTCSLVKSGKGKAPVRISMRVAPNAYI